MTADLVPVVLAGGNGVRLWPLSRAAHPKPYLPLLPDGTTPFQAAAEAASTYGDPLVIGRHAHRFLAAEQLAALSLRATLVLEPDPRGEGAAIALAAWRAPSGASLLVLPSEPPGELPGIGILQAATWSTGRDGDRVVWDVVPVDVVRRAVVQLFGEEGAEAFAKASKTIRDLAFHRVSEVAWQRVPHLDADLLRRTGGATDHAAEAGPHLEDWAAVHRAGAADEAGNVLAGDVVAVGTRGSLVHAEHRLVSLLDVEDLVVVETRDAVLVAPVHAGDRVRDLVAMLEMRQRDEARVPPRVLRPWGAYTPIGRGDRWLAKRIVVQPGQALSLQRHTHRAEHWVVVSGTARVTRGDRTFDLDVDASTYIPKGVVHRLENPGDAPLVLVEVQTGDHLDEADIERLLDRYGRDD